MSIDAYKIAVTLSLNNQVSKGLLSIMSHFGATEAAMAKYEARLKNIQKLAMGGTMVAGAGFGMLALLKAPLEEAAKFDQAVAKFKLFGMSEAVNKEAVGFAKSMNVIGSSYVENMKLMTEAQGVFRESGLKGPEALEAAKMAAPVLAKIQFATAGLDEESQAKMKTQSLAMLRYVEMSGGLQSAQKFNEIADAGFRLIQTSGGNVNWEQLRQYKARAGVSGMNITDEGMAALEPIIGELKGSTAGFGSKTAFNRLNGVIRVPNQAAHELVRAGVWDDKKIEWNSQGGIKQFLGSDGPLKKQYAELMDSNPVKFYQDVILPMYAKMNKGKGLDQRERFRENAVMFGATGGANFSLIDKQMAAIQRSVDSWKQAKGIDESVGIAGKTMQGKEIDLHAKYANLMKDLGDNILPLAIAAMEKLNPMLKDFGDWIAANPGKVKFLTEAFVGLSAALIFGGSVMLLTSAFRGLELALQLTSIGGPVGIMRIGASLFYPISQLSRLGIVAGVAGAAFAGWQLGTWLYDTYLQGTKFSDWLGSLITKMLAFMGNDAAKQTLLEAEMPNPNQRAKYLALMAAEKKHEDEVSKQMYAGFGASGLLDALKHPFTSPFSSAKPSDNKYVKLPSPSKKQEYNDADAGVAELHKIIHSMKDNQQASTQIINLNVDGKKVASYLIPNNMTGTSGFNTSADRPTPGMTSLGMS